MTAPVKISDEMLLGHSFFYLADAECMQWANFDFSNIGRSGKSVQDITIEIENTFKEQRNQWRPYLTLKLCYINCTIAVCLLVWKIFRIIAKRYELGVFDLCGALSVLAMSPLSEVWNRQVAQIEKNVKNEIKQVKFKNEINLLFFWYKSYETLTKELEQGMVSCNTLLSKTFDTVDKNELSESLKKLTAAYNKALSDRDTFQKFSKIFREIILSKDYDTLPMASELS